MGIENYSEEQFKRWKLNMIEALAAVQDDIGALQYNSKSPITSKRYTVKVEGRIKALAECFD